MKYLFEADERFLVIVIVDSFDRSIFEFISYGDFASETIIFIRY